MWPAQLIIRIAYRYCRHVFLSSCTFIQQACPTVRPGLSTNRGRGKRWPLRLWKSHCIAPYLTQLTTMFYIHLVTYAMTLPRLHMNTNKTMLPRSKPLLFRPWWEALHGTSRLWIPNKGPIGNKDSYEYFAQNRSTLHWAVQDTDFFDLKTPILLTIFDIAHC